MVEKISPTAKEGIEAAVLKMLPRKAKLRDSEVRIEVRSASINFPELLMMQNKYQAKPKLPFVLCTEGAGVVREVGAKAAERFRPGDRVLYSWDRGCACEELVLPAAVCHPLPDPLSFSQGAGFLMIYETAYHSLVHRGRLQPGEWLLVTGAGGGVGSAAVQLGKALGTRVIAAASSKDKLELCKRLGADHVVNYSGQGLAKLKETVGEITGGAFCDVIFEPVGGDVFNQCVRCVATKGYARLLVIGFAGGTIPKSPVNMVLIRRFDLVGCMVYGQLNAYEPKKRLEMLTDLLKLAGQGKLAPYVCAEFPVESYKEAFGVMEQQKVIGKVCITFGAGSTVSNL
eukprot:gnl/TRDRNA2_/TRDRNA2_198771_c0_seq1.p1 gnl/TRDRNA2_/TRDRNA2_198771_c0~~gnl/TRDRNA2_/TRDRNA2_198771_c0_seq1.p1  ORF type:complete len:343 (+),score=62.50 gnl/TRDRNA2_/TRDRNA2_198771_c0_seq1:225-1253(+)